MLGLGPIGMLSALALQARGYRVTIHSLEAEDHPRAMLMRSADVAYTASLSGAYDVIIEAAGSAELALKALSHLSSCGVFITLGARSTLGEFSFIHLIVGNQTIAGSVNSSPESFRRGVEDLSLFPRSVLDRMIRRFPFSAFQSTLFDPPPGEPKFVHRMSD